MSEMKLDPDETPSHGQERSSLSPSPPDRPQQKPQIEGIIVNAVKHVKDTGCVSLNEKPVAETAELTTLPESKRDGDQVKCTCKSHVIWYVRQCQQ